MSPGWREEGSGWQAGNPAILGGRVVEFDDILRAMGTHDKGSRVSESRGDDATSAHRKIPSSSEWRADGGESAWRK